MNKFFLFILTTVLLLVSSSNFSAAEDDKAVQARFQIYKPMFGKAYATAYSKSLIEKGIISKKIPLASKRS